MDKQAYLSAFDQNWQGLLQAAELGWDAPVPSCPGWNVGALVGHMGSVFTFWNKWVRDRPRGYDEVAIAELRAELDEALPGFTAWRKQGFTAEAAPAGAREFAQRYQTELFDRLTGLDPQEPVWTFFPPNRTAGFVQRRIAHETAVHCWDAQAAHGIAEPIREELARDGVDEFLEAILQVIYLDEDGQGTRPSFQGESYRFYQTDGPGQWLVEFAPNGIQFSREPGHAAVSIGGTASDLRLFTCGRISAGGLDVSGDTSLVDRWPELAGTF
jgi:uncharacterized protein (TIGR03083 family)